MFQKKLTMITGLKHISNHSNKQAAVSLQAELPLLRALQKAHHLGLGKH